MTNKIEIYLDPNERNSQRPAVLIQAINWTDFETPQFAELGMDMMLVHEGKRICWELKTVSDFWASLSDGRLGLQTLEALKNQIPAQVAVFGSLDEVIAEKPETEKMGRALAGDLFGLGVPVHFFSSDELRTFQYILGYSKNYLLGGSLVSWLQTGYDWQRYAMLGLPGIGEKSVGPMMAAYRVQLMKRSPSAPDIPDVIVGGKRLGKAKAEKIYNTIDY